MSLIDSHCHVNHPDLAGDLPQVLHRAQEAGVSAVVCAGYDPDSSAQAHRLAGQIRMVYAAVGVHPHDAGTFSIEVEEQIRQMAHDRKNVVAIGETGLDYYYDLSPRDVQQDVYRRHIRMAKDLDLPLIVHSRDSQADVLAILKEQGLPPRGAVMHCLPADRGFAEKAIELGCYVGIGGMITFRNAGDLREIIKGLTLNAMLLETDSPYLTPHPYRGKRNEPSYLPLVAAELANVLGTTPEEVSEVTTSNARRLFGIEPE